MHQMSLDHYRAAVGRAARRLDPLARTRNVFLRLAAAATGPMSPGTPLHGAVDRHYSHIVGLDDILSATGAGTSMFRSIAPQERLELSNKKALVVMLRGHGYGHLLHNYMVACCLRELGYRVTLVRCNGDVEHCGMAYEGRYDNPPFSCNSCRRITRSFAGGDFPMLDFNEFRSRDEDHEVRMVHELAPEQMKDFSFGGIPLMENLRHHLMRYYKGDWRWLPGKGPGVIEHFKAAVRYMGRFHGLLKHHGTPSVLCLFNGFFHPECLFLAQAASSETATLCVERGIRRNTIFISLNDAACHYRCDELWTHVRADIEPKEIGKAKEYMEDRLRGPEDPTGRRRDIIDGDTQKYEDLARQPYVILFAPVTYDTASMGKADPAGSWYDTLSLLCALAVKHQKKLVVRAHPDELSVTGKAPVTVRQFMEEKGLLEGQYVTCLHSDEKWNPYALARSADAIVVYNGTLGVELPALGHEIFNVAASHYAGKGFTRDIKDIEGFEEVFRATPAMIEASAREEALRYLYYYTFIASVNCDKLIEEHSPFRFRPVVPDDVAVHRDQFDIVKDRIRMLLEFHAGKNRPLSRA